MASRPPMKISHLSIDIVSGRDPVQGTLDDGTGCRRPFVGWIELVSAVERARQSDARDLRGRGRSAVDPDEDRAVTSSPHRCARLHVDVALKLVARAEQHIASHHAGVSGSTRREDLLALAEDDGPLTAGTHDELAA